MPVPLLTMVLFFPRHIWFAAPQLRMHNHPHLSDRISELEKALAVGGQDPVSAQLAQVRSEEGHNLPVPPLEIESGREFHEIDKERNSPRKGATELEK